MLAKISEARAWPTVFSPFERLVSHIWNTTMTTFKKLKLIEIELKAKLLLIKSQEATNVYQKQHLLAQSNLAFLHLKQNEDLHVS